MLLATNFPVENKSRRKLIFPVRCSAQCRGKSRSFPTDQPPFPSLQQHFTTTSEGCNRALVGRIQWITSRRNRVDPHYWKQQQHCLTQIWSRRYRVTLHTHGQSSLFSRLFLCEILRAVKGKLPSGLFRGKFDPDVSYPPFYARPHLFCTKPHVPRTNKKTMTQTVWYRIKILQDEFFCVSNKTTLYAMKWNKTRTNFRHIQIYHCI